MHFVFGLTVGFAFVHLCLFGFKFANCLLGVSGSVLLLIWVGFDFQLFVSGLVICGLIRMGLEHCGYDVDYICWSLC